MDELTLTGTDPARLAAITADAPRLGLQLGELVGVGGYSLVFALPFSPYGAAVLKVPHVSPVMPDEHPDVVALGKGPNRISLVSATGPFVLEAPATHEEAAALLNAAWRRQQGLNAGAPLVRLFELLTLGGLPAAILEQASGTNLRALLQEQPERVVPLLTTSVVSALQELHRTFGVHGDLKPEHISISAEGKACFLDPVTDDAFVGSIGYALPIGVERGSVLTAEVARLRDLVALALMFAEALGLQLRVNGRLMYCLANRWNGRFSWGVRPEQVLKQMQAELMRSACPTTAWIGNVLAVAFGLLSGTPPSEVLHLGWCDEMPVRLQGVGDTLA